MDKQFKLNLNEKILIKYIKSIIIALLVVIDMIICAQAVNRYIEAGGMLQLILVLSCCLVLIVLETVDSFFINSFKAKMVFYGVDSVFLLFLCILTGDTYLSLLYCIVLTQFYISVNDIKRNVILFGVSCGMFVIAFVCGWVAVNQGASLFRSLVDIIGACISGVAILAIHCAVTNFILKFYSNNVHLRQALKEADESKTQLKEVYEQLSKTAVFEERNRIAKDIHDNAGHSLTTVIMQTEAAKLLIDENPKEAKNAIISANMQAKNALDQMRESVHLLAGRGDVRSVKEDVEEIIAQTIDGTGLKIRSDLDEIAVESEQSRFISNTVKECIANGIRHGGATAFYIELKKSPSSVKLLISDNGSGVSGEINEGFGLKGIRGKAEELGGGCEYSGEDGEGFEVEITLPLKSAENKKTEVRL